MTSCLASAQRTSSRCLCSRLPVPFRPARSSKSKSRVNVKTYALGLPEIHDAITSSWHGISHTAQQMYILADDDMTAAATAAASVAKAAAEAKAGGSGNPVDWLADGFEAVLKVLDGLLEKSNVPYAYGFSIILLTILVKLATFPLSQKQVESTLALQALQPRVKELQAKYADNPEELQLETARLYRDAGVNPLAGCLPTLATIPVFIGLYRALTKAAEEGLLTDPFFFIPSLGGPASISAQQDGTGLSWLFPLKDGAPPIGWESAGAYLVLPVLLVVSQFITQKLISPQQQSTDPAQQSTQAILKFLPLMIGWFSLNVPSGLTLYWFTNNILSTAQQLYLKNNTKVSVPETVAAGGTFTPEVISSDTPIVKPKEERVKKTTGKELGSRKKKDGDRGGKFMALKAREAAKQAAALAEPTTINGNGSKGEAFAALKQKESAANGTAVGDEVKVPDAPPAKDNTSA